jgi:hypothetical protein
VQRLHGERKKEGRKGDMVKLIDKANGRRGEWQDLNEVKWQLQT